MCDVMQERLIFDTPYFQGDDVFYATSAVGNGLYKINLKKHTCDFIGFFPNEKHNSNFLYSDVLAIDDRLFYTPFSGKKIVIYNILKNSFENIQLHNYTEGLWSLFYKCALVENKIIFFPCRYEYFVELDIKTYEVKEYKLFSDEDMWRWKSDEQPFAYKGACVYKNKVLLGSGEKSFIKRFDIKNGYSDYIDIPYNTDGVSNIEVYKENVYIIGKNGMIIKWEPDTSIFECLCIIKGTFNGHYGVFFESVLYNDILYLSCSDSRTVVRFSCEDNKYNAIQLPLPLSYKRSREFPFDIITMCKGKDGIILHDTWEGAIYKIGIGFDNDDVVKYESIKKNSINYDGYLRGLSMKTDSIKHIGNRTVGFVSFLCGILDEEESEEIYYE